MKNLKNIQHYQNNSFSFVFLYNLFIHFIFLSRILFPIFSVLELMFYICFKIVGFNLSPILVYWICAVLFLSIFLNYKEIGVNINVKLLTWNYHHIKCRLMFA